MYYLTTYDYIDVLINRSFERRSYTRSPERENRGSSYSSAASDRRSADRVSNSECGITVNLVQSSKIKIFDKAQSYIITQSYNTVVILLFKVDFLT